MSNSTLAPVIQAQQLSKTYTEAEHDLCVLEGIDLTVKTGECLAIVGASGSGKSTLLHLLSGLDRPTTGNICICGQDIQRLSETQRGLLRNRHLGFIYQFHHLLPEFTALENVMMPLMIRGEKPVIASEQATALLAQVGLQDRMNHRPGQLSGGERQRTAIARALITKPNCVLADEPTGNLDQENAMQVFDLLLELNRSQQTALILVTHDMALATRMDHIYRLQQRHLLLVS